MRKQQAVGVALVVVSWVLLFLAALGPTPEERDATAVLLALPLGLYMIFSEEDIIS